MTNERADESPTEKHIATLDNHLQAIGMDIESKQDQVVRLNREIKSLRAIAVDIEAVVYKAERPSQSTAYGRPAV